MVMKKPDDPKRGFNLEWLGTDSLAWILCKPRLKSHESQLRSCTGTNYIHKGEPFIVYEELTLPEVSEPGVVQNCQVYLSKDTIKDLTSKEQRFYSFPIRLFPESLLTSITGSANYSIMGKIDDFLMKNAGIEVWSYNFTIEPNSTGDGHSPRIIISITDLSKFINSILWVDGYMHLGNAKILWPNQARARPRINSMLFSYREMMKSRRIQACRIKDLQSIFNCELILQDAVRGPEADAINQHQEKQKEDSLSSAEKLSIQVEKEKELIEKWTISWENDPNKKVDELNYLRAKILEYRSSYDLEAVEVDEPQVVRTVAKEELVRMNGSKRKREPDDDDLIDDGDLYR